MNLQKTSHMSNGLKKLIREVEKEFARRIGDIFIKGRDPNILKRYSQIIEKNPNYRILEAVENRKTIGAIGYQPLEGKIDWLFLSKDHYYHPFQAELLEKAIIDLKDPTLAKSENKGLRATLWCPKLLKKNLIAPVMQKYQLLYANRHMMACLLKNFNSNLFRLPEGYEIKPWHGEERDAIARVISSAYSSSVPFNLQPIWRNAVTVEGALEQLEGLFTGQYGEVNPKYLTLIRCKGKICAVNISTISTAYSGYIVNLAVAPEHQHKGLGTVMLRHSMKQFKLDGYKWACLAVRERNPAVNLYRREGFRNRAYVLSIASR